MKQNKRQQKYIGMNLLSRREIRLLRSEIAFWTRVLKRDRLPYPATMIKGWIRRMKRELDRHHDTRMKGAFTPK